MPVKSAGRPVDISEVIETTRLPGDASLTVDQVASITRRDPHVVRQAIANRSLVARRERGEWVVRVRDMRRWLARS